ncbi:MAG TPA: peptidylprolyl isomerase [bacterium]|nr:peptidylprolyl isomerase [bacterium]
MRIKFLKKPFSFLKKHRKKLLILLIPIIIILISHFFIAFRNRNVIAVVDGYRITLEDILVELEMSPEFYKESASENPEAAIEAYIDQIIIYRKAKRYKNRYKRNMAAKMENFYIKTLSKEFVENELVKNIKIEDAAIAEYYNSNLEDFIIPEKVRIFEIVVSDRQKAEEILKRLSFGESFEAIALKESISESRIKGGDLGWIDTRKLESEISSMVTRISPGDILANIVRTELGYHIIRLAGRTERRILSLSEATPSIKNMLVSIEKKREIDNLILKQREKGKIKIFKEKMILLKEGAK